MPEPAYEEENYDELGAELEQPTTGLPDFAPQVPGQAQPAAAPTDRARLDALYAAALKRQQELQALQDQQTDLGEQAITATQPQRDAAIAQAQQLGTTADRIARTQTAPTLPEPPRMQNFLNRDVAGNMLAIATLIGGINSNGSIRSIRANQALAASVNGFMEGNLLVAKLGLEDWKNQVFKQAKEFEMIRQNNNDIMNADGKSLEAKQAEVDLAMKPFGMRMELLKNKHQFVRDMATLDHNLFEIVDATIKTAAKVDPTIAALNLRIKEAQARTAEAHARQAEAGKPGDNKERRMELQALITSAQKERDALEKKIGSLFFGQSPWSTPEDRARLNSLNSQINAWRKELDSPTGTPTTASPQASPSMGTPQPPASEPGAVYIGKTQRGENAFRRPDRTTFAVTPDQPAQVPTFSNAY